MLHEIYDTFKHGLGGVFYGPDRHPHVWRLPLLTEIYDRIVTAYNSVGGYTMFGFEIPAGVTWVTLV